MPWVGSLITSRTQRAVREDTVWSVTAAVLPVTVSMVVQFALSVETCTWKSLVLLAVSAGRAALSCRTT